MDYQSITRPADAFQQPVSQEQIVALTQQAFGSHRLLQTVREFGTGLFNNSYYLAFADGGKAVLRIGPAPTAPVCAHEQNLLRREQAIASHLHDVTSLFPRTLYADFQQKLIDRDFVFQTNLPGTVWDEVQGSLTTADNETSWRDLAVIAQGIHALPGPTFGFPGSDNGWQDWPETICRLCK